MFLAETGSAFLPTFWSRSNAERGISADFVNGIILFPLWRFIDLWQKTASLADHSLALQFLSYLVDGSPRVPVGAIWSTVHCCGSDWYLLFFTPQQSHSRRAQSVLWQRLTGNRSSSEFFILGEEQKSHCKNFYPTSILFVKKKG